MNLPENQNIVGRVLTHEQKIHLFRTAAKTPEWDVAFCAAVIAVNTTCRKIELLTARWADVDLFGRVLSIRRSKTEAGHRLIPLNDDAMAGFVPLRKRASELKAGKPRALRISRVRKRKDRLRTRAKNLQDRMAQLGESSR